MARRGLGLYNARAVLAAPSPSWTIGSAASAAHLQRKGKARVFGRGRPQARTAATQDFVPPHQPRGGPFFRAGSCNQRHATAASITRAARVTQTLARGLRRRTAAGSRSEADERGELAASTLLNAAAPPRKGSPPRWQPAARNASRSAKRCGAIARQGHTCRLRHQLAAWRMHGTPSTSANMASSARSSSSPALSMCGGTRRHLRRRRQRRRTAAG